MDVTGFPDLMQGPATVVPSAIGHCPRLQPSTRLVLGLYSACLRMQSPHPYTPSTSARIYPIAYAFPCNAPNPSPMAGVWSTMYGPSNPLSR